MNFDTDHFWLVVFRAASAMAMELTKAGDSELPRVSQAHTGNGMFFLDA